MLEKFWKKILRRKRLSLYSLIAILLWIVSLFYRFLIYIISLFQKVEITTKTPLVSIGNITVGGTGKTPIVASITDFLLKENYRVGIVSSGYGRKSTAHFLLEGHKIEEMSSEDVGDEVKHLAELHPNALFSVHQSKAEAARLLDESDSVDIIIVDDGFQHRQLARNLNIVTIDSSLEDKMLHLFPYGLLREPETKLSEADIIIFTRTELAYDLSELTAKIRNQNQYAQHYIARFAATEIISKDQQYPIKYLEDKSVFLFAGIGNFNALEKQVARLSAEIDFALEFSDHQEYTVELLEQIKLRAEKLNSDLILTTGKDAVKIGEFDFGREFYYLNQVIDLDPGEEKLLTFLESTLDLKKENP